MNGSEVLFLSVSDDPPARCLCDALTSEHLTGHPSGYEVKQIDCLNCGLVWLKTGDRVPDSIGAFKAYRQELRDLMHTLGPGGDPIVVSTRRLQEADGQNLISNPTGIV